MTIIKKFKEGFEIRDIINTIDFLEECKGQFIKDYENGIKEFLYFEETFIWLYDYFSYHMPNVKIKWKKLNYCFKVTINIYTKLEKIRTYDYKF